MILTWAKAMRLKAPATSSWSRLTRSSAFASTHVEATAERVAEQRLDAGADQRGARHRPVLMTVHNRPALLSAYRRHSRSWSSIEAWRCWSEE